MHSIFNDVLGPVMAGPSSSHSAGCARIGKMVSLLWGHVIQKAVVVYDSQGSYPSTCIGQGSNFGFNGGLLGMRNDDPAIKNSEVIAKEKGINISFTQEKLSASHPNEARVDVYDHDDKVALSVLTKSIGGGMFEIVEMDGFPIFLDGSTSVLFCLCKEAAASKIKAVLQAGANEVSEIHRDGNVLLCAASLTIGIDALAESVENEIDIIYVRKAPAILPVPRRNQIGTLPFSTALEATAYAENNGKSMWELAIEYECALGQVEPSQVWELAAHTLAVMRKAMIPPDPNKTHQFGFLPYQSANMKRQYQSNRTVDVGSLQKSIFGALAVMENSCAHNIVVAAPTAGSSGVIPAAVVATADTMGCSDEETIKALLAAGLVGAFIANQATFGAEEAGCQAENGAASAMAAGGVVQLLGGSVRQGCEAASLALQNLLGLVCDPVAGLTEIPCISRNVAAMSNAVLSANMVLLGFDPVIPLDETIQCMLDVGRALPASLRCTCEGGLCMTPCGQKLAEKQRIRNNQQSNDGECTGQ